MTLHSDAVVTDDQENPYAVFTRANLLAELNKLANNRDETRRIRDDANNAHRKAMRAHEEADRLLGLAREALDRKLNT